MSSINLQKRSSSRTSASSSSTNNRSKLQNNSSKRNSSPKSKNQNNNSKRVQIATDTYFGSTLSPMASGYLTRRLIKPWRRTGLLECTETQIPTTQIWVQTQQQMFELQAIAKSRGSPDSSKEFFSSPYPQ